jgi:hypothetical protein
MGRALSWLLVPLLGKMSLRSLLYPPPIPVAVNRMLWCAEFVRQKKTGEEDGIWLGMKCFFWYKSPLWRNTFTSFLPLFMFSIY